MLNHPVEFVAIVSKQVMPPNSFSVLAAVLRKVLSDVFVRTQTRLPEAFWRTQGTKDEYPFSQSFRDLGPDTFKSLDLIIQVDQ